MKPLLSIITVCLNAEDTIGRTLESVLRQDFHNFEFVIKDGGSSDGTNYIIETYKKRFFEREIQLIHLIEKDNGIYSAMNQAVEHCSGTWINFLNAGDYYYNSSVLRNVFKIDAADIDLFYGDIIMVDEYGAGVSKGNLTNIKRKMPFGHQSAFIRKEWMRENPYNEKFRIGADYDNVLKMYVENKRFYYTNNIVAVYFLDGISSTKFVQRIKEEETILNQYKLSKGIWRYLYELFEAYVKQVLNCILPKSLKGYIRNIYKYKIKKLDRISLIQ